MSQVEQGCEPVMRDVPERSRFEISQGGRRVGLAEYRRQGAQISFIHTETDPALGGRGLGSRLVAYALDRARDQGLQVLPYCSFVRHVIARQKEYLDLVPASERSRFGLGS